MNIKSFLGFDTVQSIVADIESKVKRLELLSTDKFEEAANAYAVYQRASDESGRASCIAMKLSNLISGE